MQLPSLHRVFMALARRTWLVVLVTIVICSAFAARAVAALTRAEPEALPAARPPSPRVAPPTRAKPDASGFVARNIFCSSCEPKPAVGPGPVHYTGEPAVLIATMLGAEPRATVRVLASEAQGSWGLGERIPGVGTVDRIGGASIDVLDAAGHRGTISLLDTPAPAAGARVGSRPAPAATADPFADRIKKISDSTYEVDRGLVRELVSGATKAGGARVVPVVTDGDVKGVRLLGVRGGSVASSLGLRSNDVISAIDGAPIKNAQQLLDLYARLDQVSSVELSGTRGGKVLALSLRLH